MASEFDPGRLMAKIFPQSCRISKSGEGCITHTCLLCDVAGINCFEWEAHLQCTTHREREGLLSCAQTFWSRRNHVEQLKPRILSLALEKWRDSVNSKLLDFVTHDNDRAHEEATVALDKYEILERVSLLELAVWKAACQMSSPSISLVDPLDFFVWFASGWKQNKKDARHSPMISVVMTQVMSFLRPPILVNEDGSMSLPMERCSV